MDEWVKKTWHTHTHTGIILGHKEEQNPATCNNLDETWGHYTKWNESDREDVLYDLA